VAAAGAKKKRTKSGSGWSWRLAGIALCAFFALGVVTGLSQSGRMLALRIESLLQCFPRTSRFELIPAAYRGFFVKGPTIEDRRSSSVAATQAIALAEHQDGLYQVDSQGGRFGPISAADAADVPVLSGSEIEHATAAQLLEYAGELVRAEAALGAIVSEMRVTSSGEIHLYLDQPHLVVAFTGGCSPLELARAGKVLSVWRERSSLIRIIDMTVPDEAIVRLQAEGLERPEHLNMKRVVRSFGSIPPFHDRAIFSEAAVTR